MQSRYLFIIIISMAVPTVFVGGCLYYFIFTVMAEQIIFPDIIARDLMPVVYKINLMLAIGIPTVLIFMVIWAVILSFRFVAPLERLEEDIQKIDEGDYSVRLQISRDHDLRPIAEVINDLVYKLEMSEKGQD